MRVYPPARTTELLALTHQVTLNLAHRDKFKVKEVALESAGQVCDCEYQRGQRGTIYHQLHCAQAAWRQNTSTFSAMTLSVYYTVAH